MPILGNFPSGGGGGTGGLTLAAVTDIQTLAAAGKVYVKWTDPDDLVVAGSTLAAWGGTLLPNGMAKDIDEEVDRYNDIIAANPIDIQILGIGRNGHIAFNEPGTPFDSLTHKVQLTESTIKANSRFFDNEDEVPRQAICMGIKSIMQSKKIVLLAFGESKQDAVKALVEGPVTEEVPASILQDHPDVTVICDEVAAAKLDPKYRK